MLLPELLQRAQILHGYTDADLAAFAKCHPDTVGRVRRDEGDMHFQKGADLISDLLRRGVAESARVILDGTPYTLCLRASAVPDGSCDDDVADVQDATSEARRCHKAGDKTAALAAYARAEKELRELGEEIHALPD